LTAAIQCPQARPPYRLRKNHGRVHHRGRAALQGRVTCAESVGFSPCGRFSSNHLRVDLPIQSNKRRQFASRMAATAVGSKYEHLKLASAAENLRPPFDPRRKHNPDRRDRSRLRRTSSGAIRPLEIRRHHSHARSLDSPLLLLPRHRALGRRASSRHSFRFLYRRRNRQS